MNLSLCMLKSGKAYARFYVATKGEFILYARNKCLVKEVSFESWINIFIPQIGDMDMKQQTQVICCLFFLYI